MTNDIKNLQAWYKYQVSGLISIGGIEKKYEISTNTLYRLLTAKRTSKAITQDNLTKSFAGCENVGYDSQKVYEPKK